MQCVEDADQNLKPNPANRHKTSAVDYPHLTKHNRGAGAANNDIPQFAPT